VRRHTGFELQQVFCEHARQTKAPRTIGANIERRRLEAERLEHHVVTWRWLQSTPSPSGNAVDLRPRG
jgi:hypothetical protein